MHRTVGVLAIDCLERSCDWTPNYCPTTSGALLSVESSNGVDLSAVRQHDRLGYLIHEYGIAA